jgi:hypothetical protein
MDIQSRSENKFATTTAPKDPIESNNLLLFLTSFNDLVNLNKSDCGYDDANNLDPGLGLYMNSTTNNCFCQEIYFIMQTISRTTNILYNQLSPLLFGKILYAPNTPAYKKLIKRSNATFENAETLLKYIGGIADTLSYVLKTLNLDQDQGVEILKQNINFLTQQLNLNRSINIDEILLQTRLTVQKLYFIRNLGYCIELDRFVGYETEG